ncbi:MAG: DUF4238 domain-containing protein [Anaerovoracaceae bacterium]
MPANKKHHFVPRFHLKKFSSDGKSINLLNIPSNKVIIDANLTNQCYKNYFYGGDDKIEKSLGLIEGAAAKVFKDIIESSTFPKRYSKEHSNLLIHVLIQHARTSYAAEFLDETINNLAKHVIVSNNRIIQEDIDKVRITINNGGSLSVGIAALKWHLASDLHYKIVVCKQHSEFIMSDNPAIYYNQLFEKMDYLSAIGIVCKGLQIFIPLSPTHLLIFYDQACYKVGSKNSDLVILKDQADVDAINILQVVNASKNIYFNSANAAQISRLRSSFGLRRSEKSKMMIQPSWETEGERAELVISSKVSNKTGLKLGFIKPLKNAERFMAELRKSKNHPAIFPRNQQLLEDDREYQEAVKNKLNSPGGFFEFVRNKYQS